MNATDAALTYVLFCVWVHGMLMWDNKYPDGIKGDLWRAFDAVWMPVVVVSGVLLSNLPLLAIISMISAATWWLGSH